MKGVSTRLAAMRAKLFGCVAILGIYSASPAMAQAVSDLILTSTSNVSFGVAAPGESARLGADEQLDLSGRARVGPVRLSALLSTDLSAGLGATARWSSYSAVQTLRWSWPSWPGTAAGAAAAADFRAAGVATGAIAGTAAGALATGAIAGTAAIAAAPDFLAALEVKELAASVSGELAGLGLGFKAELGKFPLKWGVGKAFRPSDIFRTMDYSTLIPQAGGTPAARLSTFPSALSKVEAVAAVDGQGTIAAGARYLTSISDSGAFAVSAGWRRAPGASDELSASLEGQLDIGIFSPYAEISARCTASASYLYAMFGNGVAFGPLSLYTEGQGTVGLSATDLRFFSLATWKLSDLTSISIPLFWFNDTRTASGGFFASLEGIFGGRLSVAASGALLCARSPLIGAWNLSAAWARSLSASQSLSTY